MHIVIADASCRPDKREEMLATLTELAAASRNDEGCISYSFFTDIEDENRFVSIEEWESAELAQAHMGQDHTTKALGALPDLVAAPPAIRIHDVASSADMG